VAQLDEISVLESVTGLPGFHTAIYLTYGADLAFFEEAILHGLWQKDCRYHLIFMDAERYADTVGDLRDSAEWVGRRYIVVPVQLGSGRAFHPKVMLLLGPQQGRLLVGSGNLTFTGLGQNHELFTCLDWTPEQSEWLFAFSTAWRLICDVQQRFSHSDQAQVMLAKTLRVAPWLNIPAPPSPQIEFAHSLDEPLIEHLARAIGNHKVTKLSIAAPFLDNDAEALRQLYLRFLPADLTLTLQVGKASGNSQALDAIRQSGIPLKVHGFSASDRYLHAKAYILETAEAGFAVTGSANCSRVAWLRPAGTGNLEAILIHRANDVNHFDSVLAKVAAPEVSGSLEQIGLRPPTEIVQGSTPCIHLLDLVLEHNTLTVTFTVDTMLDGVVDLVVGFPTFPGPQVKLGPPTPGRHQQQIVIEKSLKSLLSESMTAAIFGLDADERRLDLRCNRLWLTNLDVLRREVSKAHPTGTSGEILGRLQVGSDQEWQDLFETISSLVELQVSGLRQRAGPYTTSPPIPRAAAKRKEDGPEHEVEIRLVQEFRDDLATQKVAAKELYSESPFVAWLEQVRAMLPTPPRSKGTSGVGDGPPGQGREGRKWTPGERIGRRFINLVQKFVQSLRNAEYMQTISIYLALDYYSIFQRMARLLWTHDIVDAMQWAELANKINSAYFGSPDDPPPALRPHLQSHLRAGWRDEWAERDARDVAFATLLAVEHVFVASSDEVQLRSTRRQTLRTLTALSVVTDLGAWSKEIETGDRFLSTAMIYDEDAAALTIEATERLRGYLPEIAEQLGRWTQTVTVALGKVSEIHQAQLLRLARVEYGQARYPLLQRCVEPGVQVGQATDMAFWSTCLHDRQAAAFWSGILVALFERRGDIRSLARTLIDEGKRLFFARAYQEATIKLRQAGTLARRLEDDLLLDECQTWLAHVGFFLKDEDVSCDDAHSVAPN
jgi:hypothetical protein